MGNYCLDGAQIEQQNWLPFNVLNPIEHLWKNPNPEAIRQLKIVTQAKKLNKDIFQENIQTSIHSISRGMQAVTNTWEYSLLILLVIKIMYLMRNRKFIFSVQFKLFVYNFSFNLNYNNINKGIKNNGKARKIVVEYNSTRFYVRSTFAYPFTE